jgi:hypothetical protein
MSDRARIIVDPKVQWSITGRVLIHWSLFLVCILAISTMVRVLAVVGEQPFAGAFRSALISQIPIFGVMLMLLPIFLRDTLKLSNRFAGPMYRLRTALSALSRSEKIGPIKFRTGDFWQEAATDFNTVLAQLQQLQLENETLRRRLAESGQTVDV